MTILLKDVYTVPVPESGQSNLFFNFQTWLLMFGLTGYYHLKNHLGLLLTWATETPRSWEYSRQQTETREILLEIQDTAFREVLMS